MYVQCMNVCMLKLIVILSSLMVSSSTRLVGVVIHLQ